MAIKQGKMKVLQVLGLLAKKDIMEVLRILEVCLHLYIYICSEQGRILKIKHCIKSYLFTQKTKELFVKRESS